MAEVIFTESYNKRARKFLKKHPDMIKQYSKTISLMELNPFHPSLRLHQLKGKFEGLYSVSINISFRIVLYFVIKDDKIVPIDIGSHEEVY